MISNKIDWIIIATAAHGGKKKNQKLVSNDICINDLISDALKISYCSFQIADV